MRRLYNIFLALAIVASAVSCQKDDLWSGGDAEVETITCELSLAIADEVVISNLPGVAPATRVDDETIYNIWIVQFEGGKLVGKPMYLDDLTDVMAGFTEFALVSTTAESGKLVVIANAGEESLKDVLVVGASYEALKDAGMAISSMSDCEGPIMSYVREGKALSKGEQVECVLTRNTAEISATIVNTVAGLTIDSMQICNVPDIEHYIIDAAQTSDYPKMGSFFNYEAVNENMDQTQIFQMPVNMRGTANECNDESKKPYYASNTASYLLVSATYVEGSVSKRVQYRFYLGADLEKDYNIKRNTKYTYQIEISAVGDPDVDSRVTFIEDGNIFDYTIQRPSNCYILNPSATTNTYFIPVVERVNEFWGNNGYANVPDNVIEEGDTWSAELLWGDCGTGTGNHQLTITPNVEAPSGRMALRVDLLDSIYATKGNIVVAVKKGDVILWSWHFWITDYNPDSEMTYKNRYVRTVTGGQIHRYDGRLWKSGAIYDGKYMMDRNIGALTSRQKDDCAKGTLYYQFGRKDPFPAREGYFADGRNMTTLINSKYYINRLDRSTGSTFVESVNNPAVFFAVSVENSSTGNPIYANGFNWCKEQNSLFGSHLWNDFKAKNKDAKSIFDPSPLGWRVPISGTWEDFSSSNFVVDGTESWMIYNDDVYYPTNGGIDRDGIIMGPASGYEWSATPESKFNYSGMMFLYRDNGEIVTNFNWDKAYGRPVRAVQE